MINCAQVIKRDGITLFNDAWELRSKKRPGCAPYAHKAKNMHFCHLEIRKGNTLTR